MSENMAPTFFLSLDEILHVVYSMAAEDSALPSKE